MKKHCLEESRSFLDYIITMLIGLIVACPMTLLVGCQSPAKPVNRPPITCIKHIKTNADMANCLAEYDEKY